VVILNFWPYRILRRDDDDIKADIGSIMEHFTSKGLTFDMVIFIPNAGRYLGKIFVEMFGDSFEVNFVTVRRASTVAKINAVKEFVFRRKWLSNLMRHMEVLIRIVKFRTGIRQKMKAELEIGFDVADRRILVIDDSVDTGTTLNLVKSALLKKGAKSVATACISNHLLPDRVNVDYAVYTYALLRTRNSRDFNAI
jgi:hypoxanthine phosphoribosyltransferase